MNVELTNTAAIIEPGTKPEPSAITLRCQAPSDQERLAKICPIDQTKNFTAKWDGFNFVLTETPPVPDGYGNVPESYAASDEIEQLKGMPKGKLEGLAAERGVKWDKNASLETMIDRVAKAKP